MCEHSSLFNYYTKVHKMVMKVKELVRRKECFGEDPNIFTREHRLSSKEIELYGKFGHLEDRPLGEYIKQSNLVSRNVLV